MFQLQGVWAYGLTLQKLKESKRKNARGVKRSGRLVSPWLASQNKYSILYKQNNMDIDYYTKRKVRWTLKLLREVWLDIGLEKVDTHQGVSVRTLLDSGATGLFMSKKLAEKQGFKLERLTKPIKVKNVDGSDNKGGSITHKVEVNLYYRGHIK